MTEIVDPDVLTAFDGACSALEREGAVLREVSLPSLTTARAAMWVISGVEYAEALRPHVRASEEQMHPFTRMLLERAEYVPATEYVHAQRVRRQLAAEMASAMKGIDVFITPTTPTPAYLRSEATNFTPENGEHPLSLSTSFTAILNITGQPALTLPCGFSSSGLPIGLQIVGRPGGESVILHAGRAFEAATEWHARHPASAHRTIAPLSQ
jgi:aspartyl-tRNA(Asn)/glutamyl-tRNA(Gln) amidotransferase subunit A